MSEKVKSIFLDNTTVHSDQIVDHDLTKPWQTIFGADNPNINSDSLVAYWRFFDVTGNDSSGNGHNIAWSSTPTTSQKTPYKNKNSTVLFDGIANYGFMTDHDDLSFGDGSSDQAFSISGWVKHEINGSGEFIILHKANSPTQLEYALSLNSTTSDEYASLKFVVYDYRYGAANPGECFESISTAEILENKWINYVITYDGRAGDGAAFGMKIYIDGKIASTTTDRDSATLFPTTSKYPYISMQNTAGNLRIGAKGAPSDFLDGNISEIAIWNRELTAAEAKALHDVKYGAMSNSFASYSPRLMLRDADNRRGQYPTVRRTGDKDRSGSFNIQFNDENTVEYKKIPTVYPGEKDQSFSITDGSASYTYSSQDNLVAHWRPQDAVIPTSEGIPVETIFGTRFIGGGDPLSGQAYIINRVTGGQTAYVEKLAEISETDDPRHTDFTERDGKIYETRGTRNSYKYLFQDDSDDGLNIGTAATWDAIIGDDAAGGSTEKMSFSMWIKPQDYTTYPRLLDFGDSDIIFYLHTASGKLRFRGLGTPSGVAKYESDSVIPLDEWTHVVVTWDSDGYHTPEIFVNGVEETTIIDQFAIGESFRGIGTNDCYIGNKSNFVNRFNGYIADVAIWNSLLSADEVKALYLNDTRWNPDITTAQDVQYPIGLLNNDSRLPELTPDITSKGLITRSHGGESFSIITDGEDISAYNDELDKTQDTDFYNVGTDRDAYPGFSSPLRSKTSFTFDITATEEQYVFRQNHDTVTGGEFHPTTDDFTGFCYYSFDEKKWVQKGETDFRYGFDHANPEIAGPVSFPSQFVGPSNFLTRFNEDTHDSSVTKEVLGYDKVGMPTITNLAPWATKYHASKEEILKTNFIKSPFLLEKISINLPIYAKHILDNNIHNDRQKEMSNYMVFLYLQKRSATVQDSSDDIDTSERILIASSSICFYNENVLYDTMPYSPGVPSSTHEIKSFYPVHTTGFSYGFDFTNDGSSTIETKEFDENITLEFIPSIFCQNFTISKPPMYYSGGYHPSVWNYCHFWPGGNSIKPFKIENTEVGGKSLTESISVTTATSLLHGPFEEYSVAKNITEKYNVLNVDNNIQRHQNNFGINLSDTQLASSSALINLTLQPTSIDTYSISSPFLLLPGDSIVLGIEKCVGDYILTAGEEKSISGSYIKIKTDPASMTLYGSLIKENKEHHSTINQDLTSNSVHEAFYGDPVLDQFEIEPISMYAGTTRDEYVSGSMSTLDEDGIPTGTRGVTKRVTDGDVAADWSLTRFNTFTDESERYYDTVLPSAVEILNSSGLINLSDNSIDWSAGTYEDPDGGDPLEYEDLKNNLNGIKDGTLDISLYDYGHGTDEFAHLEDDDLGDDVSVGTYSPYINNTNLFVDGRLGAASVPTEITEYHDDDPDYSVAYGFPTTYTRGMKAKYVYCLEFFEKDPLTHFPFSLDVSRIDSESVSILTRYATEFGLFRESEWWKDNTDSAYNSSSPTTADKDNSFFHDTHFGSGFGFGPSYQTITSTQIKNLIFRNTISTLDTNDTRTRSTAGIPPVMETNKYNYGFSSDIDDVGDMSSYAYGVRSVTPLSTTATFSANRYGQFRDMLEQRHYCRFYKTRTFTPMFAYSPGFGGRHTGDPGASQQQSTYITTGPLEITFVEENSSNPVTDPKWTRSSNLNAYATSSLPFFDDLETYPSGSNRSYISVTLNTAILSTDIDYSLPGIPVT